MARYRKLTLKSWWMHWNESTLTKTLNKWKSSWGRLVQFDPMRLNNATRLMPKSARINFKCLQSSSVWIFNPQTHIKMLRTDFRHKKDASYSGLWTSLAGCWRFQIHRPHSSSDQTGILFQHVNLSDHERACLIPTCCSTDLALMVSSFSLYPFMMFRVDRRWSQNR